MPLVCSIFNERGYRVPQPGDLALPVQAAEPSTVISALVPSLLHELWLAAEVASATVPARSLSSYLLRSGNRSTMAWQPEQS